MYGSLQISNINPTGFLLGLICPDDLWLQPWQVVDSNPCFFARNGDQNILSLQNFHLLKSTSGYQLIHFSLTRSVQEHQSRFCSDQKIDTPECGAEDLRIEPLLILPDLRCLRISCGININIDMRGLSSGWGGGCRPHNWSSSSWESVGYEWPLFLLEVKGGILSSSSLSILLGITITIIINRGHMVHSSDTIIIICDKK